MKHDPAKDMDVISNHLSRLRKKRNAELEEMIGRRDQPEWADEPYDIIETLLKLRQRGIEQEPALSENQIHLRDSNAGRQKFADDFFTKRRLRDVMILVWALLIVRWIHPPMAIPCLVAGAVIVSACFALNRFFRWPFFAAFTTSLLLAVFYGGSLFIAIILHMQSAKDRFNASRLPIEKLLDPAPDTLPNSTDYMPFFLLAAMPCLFTAFRCIRNRKFFGNNRPSNN